MVVIDKHPRWGFLKTHKALRRKGYRWNHKRIYRVYCELRLNQKRRAKKRLPKRVKQPLLVPQHRIRSGQPTSWATRFMRASVPDL